MMIIIIALLTDQTHQVRRNRDLINERKELRFSVFVIFLSSELICSEYIHLPIGEITFR